MITTIFSSECENEVLDIPVSNIQIENLPERAGRHGISHVDVVIRLRHKSER